MRGSLRKARVTFEMLLKRFEVLLVRKDIAHADLSLVHLLHSFNHYHTEFPPDNRINDDGEEILTVGAMMPIETLSRQWGDCDSKSLLFASLVRSIDLVNVSFIVMDEHLFAAVQLSPTRDDHSIRHNRDDWVLVELTDAWPLGRVPEKHLRNINNNTYKVVDLQ